MLIKITILSVIITAIYGFFLRGHLLGNALEVWKLNKTDYRPLYITVFGLLVIITIILIVISAVYLLFFRW